MPPRGIYIAKFCEI